MRGGIMKAKKILLLLIFIFFHTNLIAGSGYYEDCYYETGDRISLAVSGQISKDQGEGGFSYTYGVKSDSKSEQDVWVFQIILPGENIILNTNTPSGWGGAGWSGKPTKYSHRREIKPPYWIAWTAPETNLKPSGGASGFMFQTSYGLPGIVDYYAEGESIARCPEGMAVDFIPGYHDLTPYGPGIVGKTIGPTAPPADFKPLDFLNYIIDLKHQSTFLGWIKNKGIENSLDAKLDNARKKIEQGNTQAAKGILNAFINEVEAQGCETYDKCPEGKHLTPEAHTLLKYNAQYLISNLK